MYFFEKKIAIHKVPINTGHKKSEKLWNTATQLRMFSYIFNITSESFCCISQLLSQIMRVWITPSYCRLGTLAVNKLMDYKFERLIFSNTGEQYNSKTESDIFSYTPYIQHIGEQNLLLTLFAPNACTIQRSILSTCFSYTCPYPFVITEIELHIYVNFLFIHSASSL